MADAVRIRGNQSELTSAEQDRDKELASDGGIEIDLKQVVDVTPLGRSGGESIDLELDDDDVIEYQDADGWTEFTKVAGLRNTAQHDRGAQVDGAIDLVAALGADPTSRGRRDLRKVKAYGVKLPNAIKQDLDLLEDLATEAANKGIDLLAQPLARAAARRVVNWIERPVADEAIDDEKSYSKAKKSGLYRVADRLALTAENRLAATANIATGRSLVLLHGTFSNTEAAFRALDDTEEWDRLVDTYGGQIYSLEHKTLSENPVRNALDLARHLPDGANLDLISHSRGGLVGEFLSLAAAGELNPTLHYRENSEIREEESQLLGELAAALANKNVQVERFVRVAAPARGTILASPRLDEVAGFLFNVVDMIPGVSGWIFTVIKSLALAFLDQRTDPSVIPGLEAMMPSSPFIRLLNSSGRDLNDGLAVIAGDVDKTKGFKWLAEKGADYFYGQEHDFVVDTLSMYQGAVRPKAWVSLHAGPDVNHFTYFGEGDSRRRVEEWLTNDDPKETGFKPLDREAPELVAAGKARRGPSDGAPVIVVPDVFGTALCTRGAIAWPDPTHIALHGVGSIGRSANLTVGELLAATYGPLVDQLANEFNVATLPYDWRESLRAAATRLTDFIKEMPENATVHIVAHGAGGLVVRSALNASPAAVERVERVLLLGCPNSGSYQPLRLVTGSGRLVDKLLLLDPSKSRPRVGKAFRSYDSILECLPAKGAHRSEETWAALGVDWADAEQRLATAETVVVEEWPGKPPIAVAGFDQLTPSDAEVATGSLAFSGRRDGDGVVTVASAIAGAGAQYFVAASHGELPNQRELLAGYADLLRDGRTNRLSQVAPPDAGEVEPIDHEVERHLYPTADDLERAALGRGVARVAERQQVLHLEVVHGDLQFADHPVMVGHYAGSALDGAEGALDRYLQWRLTQRDVVNAYPGPIGTAEVALREPVARPPGAVVIGMGEIGGITATKVATSVAEGALRLAIAELERPRGEKGTQQAEGTLSLGLSTVLVGTNGPSGLSIDDAVAAIATGVANANRLLGEHDLDRKVRIDNLQFVELFEDIAIETARAVNRLARGTRTLLAPGSVAGAPYLRGIQGGLPGQPPPDYNQGGWRPIIVESVPWCDDDPCAEYKARLKDCGEDEQLPAGSDQEISPVSDRSIGRRQHRRDLTFTSIGLAARSEQIVHASQRDLFDRLIEQIIGISDPDDQVYNTLYELLLPNYLKGATRDADNLLLVLDSEATRYPWEMLASRSSGGPVEPLAVRSGMVRRLLTPTFRDGRRAVGNKALVIGDPPAGPRWPRLDGARSEARRVANLLSAAGFEVTSLIPDTDENQDLSVLNALFADEYRIIHVAAHGVYSSDPLQSGVVIGPDSFLTPHTVRQMQSVPPLVFLNCCHLGTIRESSRYNEFAASVSEQLIQDGVRAVVAAGWAVNDAAAETYAQVFYERMITGFAFGNAVHQARHNIYQDEAFAGINTWGAYQCYGDPGYKLTTQGGGWSQAQDLVAGKELRDRLLEMSGAASKAVGVEVGGLVSEIDRLMANTPREWHGGEVLYHAGSVYGELGQFEKAIENYHRALTKYDSLAPLKLLEQLSNIEGRFAAELADEADAADSATKERIENLLADAEMRLDDLMKLLGANVERLRMVAAHHRRKAQIYRGDSDQLLSSLKGARDAYWESGQKASGIDPDPTINWGVFVVLLSLAEANPIRGKLRTELEDAIANSKVEVERRIVADPSFWSRVGRPDLLLLEGLFSRDLAKRVDEVSAEYRAVFDLRSTERERRSVYAHLRFLALILGEIGSQGLEDACAEILNRLRDADKAVDG